MADVLLLSADLLFGSQVQGSLSAAGHTVALAGSRERLEQALDAGPPPAVLVVDLTDATLAGEEIVGRLLAQGRLALTATLGFYSHVDAAARERAEAAGIERVVPRSRMAREGAQLVNALVGG